MAKRKVVLAQNKDYSGKITKPVMEKIVDDFKENIEELESKGKEVAGTIINGGEGLTKGAQEVFDEYTEEMNGNDKFSIYNTNEEVNKINQNLHDKVHNKNKN